MLSEVAASRSEAATQSKDPYKLFCSRRKVGASLPLARQCHERLRTPQIKKNPRHKSGLNW